MKQSLQFSRFPVFTLAALLSLLAALPLRAQQATEGTVDVAARLAAVHDTLRGYDRATLLHRVDSLRTLIARYSPAPGAKGTRLSARIDSLREHIARGEGDLEQAPYVLHLLADSAALSAVTDAPIDRLKTDTLREVSRALALLRPDIAAEPAALAHLTPLFLRMNAFMAAPGAKREERLRAFDATYNALVLNKRALSSRRLQEYNNALRAVYNRLHP